MKTDQELFLDALEKFEVVEAMIDNEFSRRNETEPLIQAIKRLYERTIELRNHCKF
jgi:hypothetical protein